MDELEVAMAAMEDARAAFEAAAQCVRHALEVVEAGVEEVTANVALSKIELATAERKRQRLAAAVGRASGRVPPTASAATPDDGPAGRAFEDAAVEAAARLHTALRTMARLQDQTRDVRAAVDATKARAAPLLAPERLASVVEARNEGCSELLQVLGQVGPGSEAVFSSFSLVQLCQAARGCRAFRRWSRETREWLPRVLGIGGVQAGQSSVTAIETLSLATMRWGSGGDSPPPLPMPRSFCAVCASATGVVTVMGGSNCASEEAEQAQQSRQALLWSPGVEEWQPLPDMAEDRVFSCAVQLLDGRTMVTGGSLYDGSARGTMEVLAADGSGWSTLAPMGTARYAHTIGLLPSGHVIVAGGKCHVESDALLSAELWNPATNSWSALPPMAHARTGAAGHVLPSGRFVVLGGRTRFGTDRSDGEVYDPVRRVWEPLPAEMASRRSDFSAAPVPGGLIVAGGSVDDEASEAELYDEASGCWFTLPHSQTDGVSFMSLVSVPTK